MPNTQPEDIMEVLDLRFKSGNSIEIERATIKKEEWDRLKQYILDLELEVRRGWVQ